MDGEERYPKVSFGSFLLESYANGLARVQHIQVLAAFPFLDNPDVALDKPRRLNKITDAAETAAGPRERMPRKLPLPSGV